ncbi:MAG: methylated-DNA--[protein]-cysteine S-methyltransferase [Alloprevotella sp.]|jgi:methylated-DNA--[protein]-cysteine S-methyltransferase|nr:MAG: methylated-DNA--[protein]-cysteine S-methyltransferase [Alloprevotella sp.]
MKSQLTFQKATYVSPLGPMLMAGNGNDLYGLWFVGQKRFPLGSEQWEDAPKDAPFLVAARQWLDAYFAGEHPTFQGRLKPQGTPFMQAVWQEMLLVPPATTTTYTEIAHRVAQRLGQPAPAVRAASTAIGRNPISLIIPCHRVLGTDGSMRGYAGGLDRKVALLTLEGKDCSMLKAHR